MIREDRCRQRPSACWMRARRWRWTSGSRTSTRWDTSREQSCCRWARSTSRAAEVLPEKEATWLVYCRTGRRSADAVQKLDALGYSNLYDLGGILSWPYEIEGDFEGHF